MPSIEPRAENVSPIESIAEEGATPPTPDTGNQSPQDRSPESLDGKYPGMSPFIYPCNPSSSASRQSLQQVKRHQVKNACSNCQKACKKCDDARPCLRCVKYGVSEDCADSVRKERAKGLKRGPYKKRAPKIPTDPPSVRDSTSPTSTTSASAISAKVSYDETSHNDLPIQYKTFYDNQYPIPYFSQPKSQQQSQQQQPQQQFDPNRPEPQSNTDLEQQPSTSHQPFDTNFSDPAPFTPFPPYEIFAPITDEPVV